MQGNDAAVRLPFAGTVGHVEHLCDLPSRLGDHRQGPEAIALARRPAFIENRTMTRSRAGERVVTREPSMARSWVGLTIVACVPCMGTLQ
jgi:hypothetical protein